LQKLFPLSRKKPARERTQGLLQGTKVKKKEKGSSLGGLNWSFTGTGCWVDKKNGLPWAESLPVDAKGEGAVMIRAKRKGKLTHENRWPLIVF